MRCVRRSASVVLVGLLVGAVLVLGSSPAFAALSDEQEALARKIDGELIAPCCWTQTVADHQSDIAAQMKAQTRSLIAEGKGEREILDSYVAAYGMEILASPRAEGFNLLAYALPAVVFALAGGMVMVLVRRWRRNVDDGGASVAAGVQPGAGDGSEPSAKGDEARRSQLERELSRFDT
jgi:cytochrome c-type biogenesis protein CcmH